MSEANTVDMSRLVRRFPIDWSDIAEQSGCTRGKLCKTVFGWGVQDGNGDADFCCITPPKTNEGEELRIEGQDWCIYSPNKEIDRKEHADGSI